MRKEFFDYLLELMDKNRDIYIIFVGLGYPRYEEFKKKHPARTINSEASEQTALDMAVGLALLHKIPIIYTITPFYWRAAETIRTYISHEYLPVIMCGAGRDDDYSKDDGFSHDATDINILMDGLNIRSYYPEDKIIMKYNLIEAINNKRPSFISLRR